MRRYSLGLAVLSLAALVQGAARGDDQQIAQEIVQKLQAEKQAGTLKGFSIDLQVDEGTVWLSGRVASEEQLSRALDLARRAPGVQQVVNDLTVAPPAAATASRAPSKQPVAVAQPAPAPAPRTTVGSTLGALARAVSGSPSSAARPQPAAAAAQPAQPATMQTVTAQPMPIYGEPTPAYAEPTLARNPVQAASVTQEFAAAANAGPVGSGVDGSSATARRQAPVSQAYEAAYAPAPVSAVQAMPSPQPLPGVMTQAAPQQVAMVPMQTPYVAAIPVYAGSQMQVPLAMGPARTVNYAQVGGPVHEGAMGAPMPMHMPGSGVGIAPARYDHPTMPGYAWPSYAAHPNYAAVTYPKQYSPTAWPYIGPFYPYPQVPLGWRKVTLEWDDGWWMLDFKDRRFGGGHF
jgi:hypothetical protein